MGQKRVHSPDAAGGSRPAPHPPQDAAEPELTFGVEFEFILATKKILRGADGWLDLHVAESRVKTILARNGREAKVVDSPFGIGEDPDTKYQNWRTMRDVSVMAYRLEDRNSLPDLYQSLSIQNWTLAGLELTTRILNAPPGDHNHSTSQQSSFAEIESYLNALKHKSASSPYGVYANRSCGLHVHVGMGRDKEYSLPLPLLQHLSYMVAQFETIISSLFPSARRAAGSNDYISSNLMGIRRSRHICSRAPIPELQDLQDLIFDEQMLIDDLVELMGNNPGPNRDPKYKFINFSNGIERQGSGHASRTIEFRQHEGSLDVEAVIRWAQFCIKFVRAAHKRAKQSKPASPTTPGTSPGRWQRELDIHMALTPARKQGNKYKVKCKSQYEEMERLFNLLELDRQERTYWYGRYAQFNPEEVVERGKSELFEYYDQNECPLCQALQASAAEGKAATHESSSSDADMDDDDADEESNAEVLRLMVAPRRRRTRVRARLSRRRTQEAQEHGRRRVD